MSPEELYDLEATEFKNKLDGFNIKRREDQLHKAVFAFKTAYHIRSNKGFGFDDFTDVFEWFEELQEQYKRSEREWWEEKVKELEEEYGTNNGNAISTDRC